MRLLFPNGEHGPVEIKDGVTRVGSGVGADVTIVAPGIANQHCEIVRQGPAATLRVTDPANVVVVNGKQVSGEVPVKAGDLVLFSKVGTRVVAVERVAALPTPARKPDTGEDDGRTRIRQAMPRYVLRGVSGSTFGKTFPLFGTMTVGRAADCDISIPAEEISRHHAKLQVMPDGIAVEDLGSANGTFITGKRVHHGTLKPGEELRLDTVRFLLVAPGMESQSTVPKVPQAVAAPQRGGGSWVWVVVGMVVAGAIIGGLVYFGVLR